MNICMHFSLCPWCVSQKCPKAFSSVTGDAAHDLESIPPRLCNQQTVKKIMDNLPWNSVSEAVIAVNQVCYLLKSCIQC